MLVCVMCYRVCTLFDLWGLVGAYARLACRLRSQVAGDIAEALARARLGLYARWSFAGSRRRECRCAFGTYCLSVEDHPSYTAAEQTEQYRFLLSVRGRLVRSLDEEVHSFDPIEGWATYDAALSDAEGAIRQSSKRSIW